MTEVYSRQNKTIESNAVSEPIFHCFDDCIPDDHPLLKDIALYCYDCKKMVHCINEVMTAWFETGIGVMCLQCFAKRDEMSVHYSLWDELEMPNYSKAKGLDR